MTTSRSSIGPLLTAREYAARAELHRPADPDAIAAEIRRLAATGLLPRDIALSLRLHVDAVHAALVSPPDSSTAVNLPQKSPALVTSSPSRISGGDLFLPRDPCRSRGWWVVVGAERSGLGVNSRSLHLASHKEKYS